MSEVDRLLRLMKISNIRMPWNLLERLKKSDQFLSIIKSSTGTFGLILISTGLSFVTNIFIARLLGAANYGIYVYAFTWINVLAQVAMLGLDKLLVREVAAYKARSEWDLLFGILRWSDLSALGISIILGLSAFVVVRNSSIHSQPESFLAFQVALLLLPIIVFTALRQATLRGFNRIILSQVPDLLVRPVLFLGFFTGLVFIYGRLRPGNILAINVFAGGVALVIAHVLFRRSLPTIPLTPTLTYKSKIWLYSTLPLLFIGVTEIAGAKADTLILGTLRGAESVGIYSTAKRLTDLISFVLTAVNMTLAPSIASLYAVKNITQLQSMVTKAARLVLLFSLPITISMILFGKWLLLLFGPEFTRGQFALIILSGSQLFNASMGPVLLILMMTSHERDAAVGVGISAFINIALNLILTPTFDLNGTAIAAAISTIVWNILLVIWVYKKTGIHSTVFGSLSYNTS